MKIDTKFDINDEVYTKIGDYVLKSTVESIIIEEDFPTGCFISYRLADSEEVVGQNSVYSSKEDLLNGEMVKLQSMVNLL